MTPTTVIATKTLTINTTIGYKTAMFTSPVVVPGNYAVAIKNTSLTDTIAIVTNNAQVATYTEGLSHINAPGFGGWFEISAIAAPDAPEPIIAPIVSYTVTTNYTMSPATTPMCLGTALTFTNTTMPTSILMSRFNNYGSYKAYWNSVPDSVYAWNMGDLSPLQWSLNAAYTYPAAGPYDITLFTIAGLFTNCVDTKLTSVVVTPNAVSSFTVNAAGSPLYVFTSTSTGAATYSWNFGDGSPLDATANPNHTFPVGTWTVTLTVTSPGTCNTSVSTQVVTILASNIATFSAETLKVYPNPSASGLFTIETGTSAKILVEVYNLIGEIIYSNQISSATSIVDLSAIKAGVYSMKVTADDKNVVKQIVITK